MIDRRTLIASAAAGVVLAGCAATNKVASKAPPRPTIGKLESFDPRFDTLIAPQTPIEIIAEGFDWSEGPTWDAKRERLLFSDVPKNRIHAWSRRDGLSTFLEPSGVTNGNPHGDADGGTNGLWYSADDTLLICNQGGRSIDRLNLQTGKRVVLANEDAGRPLNRPNDLAVSKRGTIYFTNPGFGLTDSRRMIPYNGVYRIEGGKTSLITSELVTPNGVALSPDDKILYVAQSGTEAPRIMRYFLDESGKVTGSDLFFDVTRYPVEGGLGRGDGISVDHAGNLFFCAVDTGVYVITPAGEFLGRIFTGRKMSNCTFGEDGSVLFITADDLILRVQTKTRGATS